MLRFFSGFPTVVDAAAIEHIQQEQGHIKGIKVLQVQDDERLFLEGQFGGFRLYCLVTHTRPEVIAGSVRRLSDEHFAAVLRLELAPGKASDHDVVFRSPLVPVVEVTDGAYGLYPDAFVFRHPARLGSEAFVCDLSLLTLYAENAPIIPLQVHYIGIAKAEGRTAEDRLGEGHPKLQSLLARHVRRPTRQTVSIVLYRPTELVPPTLAFPDVLETIEASMIRFFSPEPLNIRRLHFPQDSPDLVSKLKAIGVSRVLNQVDSPKGTALYSRQVEPETRHHIRIDLPNGPV